MLLEILKNYTNKLFFGIKVLFFMQFSAAT